jgi:hypothetical protein
MRRAALAVPLALVISSSVWAGALAPAREVPPTSFSPVVIPSLAAPSATPRAPRVVDPPTLGPARVTQRPKVKQPEPKAAVATPKPKSVFFPSGKQWGVKAGARAAKAYARSRMSEAQFDCLEQLWNHESGWRWNAQNRSGSGAYGIPQALPGSKMAKAGADWRTNPITQVRWGLGYISGRYGSACAAWSHFKSHNWY